MTEEEAVALVDDWERVWGEIAARETELDPESRATVAAILIAGGRPPGRE